MRDSNDDPPHSARASDDRGIAIAIAVAIIVCLVGFVVIFVELEPFMSDFTGSDIIVTPDPSAVPTSETVTSESVQIP